MLRFGLRFARRAGLGEAVEEPSEGEGGARDGLDVTEVGAAESEADGGDGAEPVGGLEGDQAAPGADEGGAAAQQFVQGGVEGARAGDPLGELMEGGEVGDPAREAVLEHRAGSGGRRDGGDAGGTRCAGAGRADRTARTARHSGLGGFGSAVCAFGHRSVRGSGKWWIDSGHFRQLWRGHGRLPGSVRASSQVSMGSKAVSGVLASAVARPSGLCVLLNSIANPHVMLRRYQCLHMYTPE